MRYRYRTTGWKVYLRATTIQAIRNVRALALDPKKTEEAIKYIKINSISVLNYA